MQIVVIRFPLQIGDVFVDLYRRVRCGVVPLSGWSRVPDDRKRAGDDGGPVVLSSLRLPLVDSGVAPQVLAARERETALGARVRPRPDGGVDRRVSLEVFLARERLAAVGAPVLAKVSVRRGVSSEFTVLREPRPARHAHVPLQRNSNRLKG